MEQEEVRIFLSPPWTGEEERAAVACAFDSGYVAPCGPQVDAFERRLGELSGCSAAAVSSGTAALDLLMAELGVRAGDIVVASSLTFVATVGAAYHRGAEIRFVDTDPATGTMSVPLLVRALDDIPPARRARALVIAADIYGQCGDYAGLEAACAAAGVRLVVDAAEAVGATSRGTPAGSAGLAGIYSFNGNKLITTSGGGAVLAHDAELVARARWRAQQAREPVVWYEHREVGYNYRMSNILAAVGCAQFDKLPEIVRRKRGHFAAYHAALAGVAEPFPCLSRAESTCWLSVFIFRDEGTRDAMASRLAAANVECRPVWKPLHLQPVFQGARTYGGSVSEDLFRRGLCLPSGAGLAPAARDRVIRELTR